MAAYCQVYDTRHLRLTAKNRDQLQNSTLGNRVWATFTFTLLTSYVIHDYNGLMASFPGQPGQAGTIRVKPVWIYVRQEIMGF